MHPAQELTPNTHPDEGEALDAYSRTVAGVVERVGPAVVRIDIRRGDGKHGGSGSGVIVSPDGLIPNLLAFNVGVEIGQLIALAMILIVMGYWRKTTSFWKHAYTANVVMMSAGFILFGMQMTGYFVA